MCVMVPKMIGYVKCLQLTKYMSFLIEDDELLKRYNSEIWKKVSNSMKTGFDSEPVSLEKISKN